MAKREREEEFEVSEVAPLQPLLDPTVACTLHFQCYCTTIFTDMSAILLCTINDLYHYQC